MQKNLLFERYCYRNEKIKAADQEKVLASHISDKAVGSRIHKEHSKLNNKKKTWLRGEGQMIEIRHKKGI